MSLDLGLAARVVTGIRSVIPGATEWDTPGVAAALKAVGGSPGAALAAAALAAEDASLSKPSVAGFRNHWPKNADSTPAVSHDVRCPEHPINFHPCPLCAAKRCDPTEDYQAAKAALRGGPRPVSAVVKTPTLTDAEAAAIARARLDKETRP